MLIETERLLLREFRMEDYERVHKYASDRENVKYMIWGPNSSADTVMFLRECRQNATRTPRRRYELAVVLKEENCLIGSVVLYLNSELNEGELGWVLDRDYWKMGYAREGAYGLMEFAFEKLGVHRLFASCDGDNYGSYRVMEKLGMRREAHFIKSRAPRHLGKQWSDELHYGILDEEWFATPRACSH